jgi:hypothetical protein
MLHVTMVFRILCNINARPVVDEESGGIGGGIAKLAKDVAHPLDLLASLNCSNILSFSAGESDKGLML